MSSALKIKDQPANERPRERLAASGADALSNAELIAILLRTGLKGMNAVEVGKQLLVRFGSLQELARASVDDLRKVKGIGRDKAVTLVAAFALAHNHPSGDPTPSEADIKVTRDLIRAGQLLKIDVLDHVIIGRATPERTKDYSSLRELGYFYS